MALGQNRRAVGVFSNYHDAEIALEELKRSGFPMRLISVIAKDARERDSIAGVDVAPGTSKSTGKGATTGAIAGGAVGGLVGLIGALSALTIPGIGPAFVGGAVASVLGDTLLGGAIGAAAGGLVGALSGLGIPEHRARHYSDRIAQGDYLVMVEGSDDEIHRAESILNHHGIRDWGIYDRTNRNPDPVGYSSNYVTGTNPTPAAYPGNYATAPQINRDVNRRRRAVGVFPHRRDAEHALHDLRDSGFPMSEISVIAKDAGRNDSIAGTEIGEIKGNKAPESAATGAVTGGALGGLGGLLVGLGALAIPGIGPVIAGGAAATAIATTLTGGAIGAATGGIAGGLIGLGIPEDRARVYNDRVSRGDYLVMVDGNEDEIHRAEAILSRRGIQEWNVFDATDVSTHRPSSVTTHSTPSNPEAMTGYMTSTHPTPSNVTPHPTTTHSSVDLPPIPTGQVTPTHTTGYVTPTTSHPGHIHTQRRAVGVFPTRQVAERAIHELRDSGFGMDRVSVIAKDADKRDDIAGVDVKDRVGNKAPEGATTGAVTGGTLGGITGLLVGLGTLAIPGIGPILLAGAGATALATTLAGAGIGAVAGSLLGALVGAGIPEERARVYSDRVSRGEYLVMVDGTDAEIHRAESILHRGGIQEWGVYDVPHRDSDRTPIDPSPRTTTQPEVKIIDRREQIL